MLTKENLLDIGYEITPDPDQPGMFVWVSGEGGSEMSYSPEEAAIEAASQNARERHDLHLCDNCGKIHTKDTLEIARHLSERVDPGGDRPSGECSSCGALCYPLEGDASDGMSEAERGKQAIEALRKIKGLPICRHEVEAQLGEEIWNALSGVSDEPAPPDRWMQAIELLREADSFLREIRAENLDGSEPALGMLLEQTTGFWIALGRAIDTREGVDIDDVAEWVGLHYKVNFGAEPCDRKDLWVARFKESHGIA